jgi:hypothetical protein
MSLRKTKTRVLGGLAALAVVGGVVAYIGTPAARAATEHCGIRCVTLASQAYGTGNVVAVSSSGGALLAPGYNPEEDFLPVEVGTVAQLAQAGKIPASEAKTYAQEVVYELSYAPYGALTGQCLGVSSPTAGSSVVLEQCGAPDNDQPTPSWEAHQGPLWIGVYRDHSGDYEPFVNVEASTSAALVLTASSAGGPLSLNYMSLTSGYSGSTVASNQMWESLIGIYNQAQPWPTPDGNEPGWLGR